MTRHAGARKTTAFGDVIAPPACVFVVPTGPSEGNSVVDMISLPRSIAGCGCPSEGQAPGAILQDDDPRACG